MSYVYGNKFKYTRFSTDHLAKCLLTTELLNYSAKEKEKISRKRKKHIVLSREDYSSVIAFRLHLTFLIARFLQHYAELGNLAIV